MIRKANLDDLQQMLRVYKIAQGFMSENGNPNQWKGQYPPIETFTKEIKDGIIHVLERENPKDGEERIYGVFLLMDTPDPTYEVIEGGSWMSAEPYGTIHRVAGDGSEKGIFHQIISYAKERFAHLRIDTHEQNKIMQHIVTKNGFEYCGTIYLENGDPRRAYEWIKQADVD